MTTNEDGFTVVSRKKRNPNTLKHSIDNVPDIERKRDYVLDQQHTFITNNIVRNRSARKSVKPELPSLEEITQFFGEYFKGSINELKTTPFYCSTKERMSSLIRDWSTCSKSSDISIESSCVDVVCYGVGNFLSNKVSTLQLALISALADDLNFGGNRCLYDPMLTDLETKLSNVIQWEIIPQNEEGKRPLRKITHEDRTEIVRTIFFMPHCGAQLYDNLLSANWNPTSLSQLMIIGNTFSDVADRNNKKLFHLTTILPCLSEHLLENDLMDKASRNIFNHTSFHTFHSEKLMELSPSTWDVVRDSNIERGHDPEFIPHSVTSAFAEKQIH